MMLNLKKRKKVGSTP